MKERITRSLPSLIFSLGVVLCWADRVVVGRSSVGRVLWDLGGVLRINPWNMASCDPWDGSVLHLVGVHLSVVLVIVALVVHLVSWVGAGCVVGAVGRLVEVLGVTLALESVQVSIEGFHYVRVLRGLRLRVVSGWALVVSVWLVGRVGGLMVRRLEVLGVLVSRSRGVVFLLWRVPRVCDASCRGDVFCWLCWGMRNA